MSIIKGQVFYPAPFKSNTDDQGFKRLWVLGSFMNLGARKSQRLSDQPVHSGQPQQARTLWCYILLVWLSYHFLIIFTLIYPLSVCLIKDFKTFWKSLIYLGADLIIKNNFFTLNSNAHLLVIIKVNMGFRYSPKATLKICSCVCVCVCVWISTSSGTTFITSADS